MVDICSGYNDIYTVVTGPITIILEKSFLMNGTIAFDNLTFQDLTHDEMMIIEGGGPVALFMSCLAIAVSPVIICLCPPAGLALLGAGIVTFGSNL